MNLRNPASTTSLRSHLAEGVASCLRSIIEADNSTEDQALEYLEYVEEKMIPEHLALNCHLSIEDILNKSILKLAYKKNWPRLSIKCETEGSGFKNLNQEDFIEIIKVNPEPLEKIFRQIITEKISSNKTKEFLGFCVKEGATTACPALTQLFQDYAIVQYKIPSKLASLHAHEITNMMQAGLPILNISNYKNSFVYQFQYMDQYQVSILLILVNLPELNILTKPLNPLPSTSPPVYLVDFALLNGNVNVIRALSDLDFPFQFKDRFIQIAPTQRGLENGLKFHAISKDYPEFNEVHIVSSIKWVNEDYNQFLETMSLNRKAKILSEDTDNGTELKSFDELKKNAKNTFYLMAAALLHEYQFFPVDCHINTLLKKIAECDIPAPRNQLELVIFSEFFDLIVTRELPQLSINILKTLLEKMAQLKLYHILTVIYDYHEWSQQKKTGWIRFKELGQLLLDPPIFMSFCEFFSTPNFYEYALSNLCKETSIAAVKQLISSIPKKFLAELIQKNPDCLKDTRELGVRNELTQALLSAAPFTQLQRAKSFLKDEKNETADLFDYHFYIEKRKTEKPNERLKVRVGYYEKIIDLFLAIYAEQTQRFKELGPLITEAIDNTTAFTLASIRLEPEKNAAILRGLKVSIGMATLSEEEQIKNVQRMYADFKNLPYRHFAANTNTNTPAIQIGMTSTTN